jgi:hypothetical protein
LELIIQGANLSGLVIGLLLMFEQLVIQPADLSDQLQPFVKILLLLFVIALIVLNRRGRGLC